MNAQTRFSLLSWAVALLAAPTVVSAAVIASDDFESYTLGALSGQGGGIGWTGNWTAPGSPAIVEVVDTTSNPLSYAIPGGAVLNGGAKAMQVQVPSTGSLTLCGVRTLAAPIAETFYVGYLVRYVGSGTWGGFNNTFTLHLGTNSGSTTTLNFGLRGDGGSSTANEFLVRHATAAPVAGASTGGQLTNNSTYYLVCRMNWSGSAFTSANLWLNPSFSGNVDKPNGDALTNGFSSGPITHLFFRQALLETDDIVQADEIKIGTTWADVVPSAGLFAVNAGPDQNQMFPPATNSVTVTLDGTVTADAGLTYTSLWSQVSGPGTVSFADATSVDTTATIVGDPGAYVLQLQAGGGANFASDTMTVNVSAFVPDTTPPQVTITWPMNGGIFVTGTTVTVQATITDNVAVQTGELYVNGVFHSADASAPYVWQVTGLAVGPHTLAVRGVDTSGNAATNSVSVTVIEALPAVIASETFEQDNLGPLNGQGGGTGWIGNWGAPGDVTRADVVDTTGNPLVFSPSDGLPIHGGARALEVALNGAQANQLAGVRALATPLAQTFYASYLVRYTGAGTWGGFNNTFTLHLGTNSGSTTTLNFGPRGDGGGAVDEFVVRYGTATPVAGASTGGQLTNGLTYLLVCRMDWDGAGAFTNATLWLNPSADANITTPAGHASLGGFSSGPITHVFFRQAALDADDVLQADELQITQNWPLTAVDPILNISRSGASQGQITWQPTNWVLEATDDVATGVWLEVNGAASPHLFVPSEARKFFRTRRPTPPTPPANPLVLWATNDFPNINAGAVPAYKDNANNALAINAAIESYRGQFAAATTTFAGAAGTYHLTLTSLAELDGECTYRVLINGVLAGQVTNPRIYPGGIDYTEINTTFSNITVSAGATIRVEFNTHSNGLVPEGGGFAWARGRWRKLTFVPSISAPSGAWVETGGVVVMECENTSSALGQWVKINPGNPIYVSGATGTGHLEFTGNGINGGPPTSPLSYPFQINQSGVYRLYIRARKRLEGEPGDKCNDGYVRMIGNYTSGGSVALSLLQNDTKFYGGDANNWAWAAELDDVNGVKWAAEYNFTAGQTYTLVLSGRSIRWNVDRIVLRKAGTPDSTWQNAPESPRAP